LLNACRSWNAITHVGVNLKKEYQKKETRGWGRAAGIMRIANVRGGANVGDRSGGMGREILFHFVANNRTDVTSHGVNEFRMLKN